MPTKISVAMSKETGPPQDESLGVTCALEFGEGSMLQDCQTVERAFQSIVVAAQQTLQEATMPQP